MSLDDTLKVIACYVSDVKPDPDDASYSREQQKKLSALEMDLSAERHEGFISKERSEGDGTRSNRRLLAVIGIITTFRRKKNRDVIRKASMRSGNAFLSLDIARVSVRHMRKCCLSTANIQSLADMFMLILN
ncbi:Galactosyltransferase family protein isoform 3 [Hibiscus syriacus]|uniref:Galactosyltransferase family protein isoform 3 n=1 Tax=Hibiscus syriacus TaxID=106335 RepID=A0A6A3C0A7_HIBSY|nr:Galactosyltransferase family protein isoform 3 [Hibiscus syriacus]